MKSKLLPLSVGAVVGVMVAPKILDMLNIQPAAGFGSDDIASAAVIVLSIWAADMVL